MVPKNAHGNVEVPPLVGVVPGGTVHLGYPRIVSTCKRIGVDFGMALVGFEGKGGPCGLCTGTLYFMGVVCKLLCSKSSGVCTT